VCGDVWHLYSALCVTSSAVSFDVINMYVQTIRMPVTITCRPHATGGLSRWIDTGEEGEDVFDLDFDDDLEDGFLSDALGSEDEEGADLPDVLGEGEGMDGDVEDVGGREPRRRVDSDRILQRSRCWAPVWPAERRDLWRALHGRGGGVGVHASGQVAGAWRVPLPTVSAPGGWISRRDDQNAQTLQGNLQQQGGHQGSTIHAEAVQGAVPGAVPGAPSNTFGQPAAGQQEGGAGPGGGGVGQGGVDPQLLGKHVRRQRELWSLMDRSNFEGSGYT
jgi:hypothetical protein